MIIKLSRVEMSDCYQAAKGREQFNRLSGNPICKIDKNRTQEQIELLGIVSEFAVSKLFGVESRIFALGVDGGIDFWLGDISVDIKASFFPQSGLIFNSLDDFRSDVSILAVHETEASVDVKGWISRPNFTKLHKTRDFGYGNRCFLEPEKLMPLEKLWLISKERELS